VKPRADYCGLGRQEGPDLGDAGEFGVEILGGRRRRPRAGFLSCHDQV